MAVFNGNALDSLRSWLTRNDTVDPGTTGPNLGTVTVTGALTDTQLRATAVPVSGTVTINPVLSTLTDRSGTITAGGTAQQAMAALATRKYLMLQNVSDTAMWFNFTTTAVADSPSHFLSANGGSFVMEGSFVSTEAISIICATTGKKWSAKEG